MLQKYPNPQDWYWERFNYEVYFGYGPQNKLHIICKASMQYCYLCIQKNFEPAEKNRKRYYYYAAIGLDFKSNINFYIIARNINVNISKQAYINQILKPIVKL